MNYRISGEGYITFKENLTQEKLTEITEYLYCAFIESVTHPKKTNFITISYEGYVADDNKSRDAISKRLNKVSQMAAVEDGTFVFTGECGKNWRFIWHNGTWVYQDADITFKDLDEEEYFGSVKWCREDIESLVDEQNYPKASEFIDEVMTACKNDNNFTDSMCEAGWHSINHHASEVLKKWQHMHAALTAEGTKIVNDYINELKAKQKEVLDAGKDTADNTTLPTVEDILSCITYEEIQWDDPDGPCFEDTWDEDVSDSGDYDLEYSLKLKYKEDFILTEE